ncbi:hypothetical protein [Niallia endozanthoxylica]|uniref:Molybdopterin cofactor biosynthesis MoaD-related C-terminal domain-containing protein n=1 Tax=Niallia endozanthoxylica TaxID=2036016 RepID=A0A5J5HX59_9BACI|nr:hypothetical protein [Niallia endozanthoxylica]KAA9027562.1 hypothetical protein F4V44_06065 [Niallia endozanthoxylica]
MHIKELEFRGISLRHLGMYLEELGGEKSNHSFPVCYNGGNWKAEILSEEEIAFTAVFKVNAVHIRFQAENNEILEELIIKFRKKTFRAGG